MDWQGLVVVVVVEGLVPRPARSNHPSRSRPDWLDRSRSRFPRGARGVSSR